MPSKKELLSTCLWKLRANFALSLAQSYLQRGVRIIAYHRVMDFDESTYPFDLELISATQQAFREQVLYLSKYYTPMTFADLLSVKANNQSIPRNAVIITFDDGFNDNYEFAFPILKEAGVPATIFISTDYMDQPETLWFDELAYIVKKKLEKDYSIEFKDFSITIPATSEHDKEESLKRILQWIKRVPDQDRVTFLQNLKEKIPIDKRSNQLSTPMTWDQVIELDKNGIEIGSHSCSHPILAQLSTEQLEHELRDSKCEIEERLKRACPVISYPVGGKDAYNNQVLDLVHKSGYQFGCTYEPGFNSIANLERNPFTLKRNHIERYTRKADFETTLAMPNIFY